MMRAFVWSWVLWLGCNDITSRARNNPTDDSPSNMNGMTGPSGNENMGPTLQVVPPNTLCDTSGWCYDYPKPFPMAYAVWAASPTQIWTSDGDQIVYFDGTTWAVQYSDDDVFNDLSGTSPSDVWAV